MLPLVGSLLDVGLNILNKVIPDEGQRAAAQLELLKLQQTAEFKEIDAQLQMATNQADINKVEAASSNLFVSGWRPAIGWSCGAAFAVQFIIGPLVEFACSLSGHPVKFPQMELDTMMPVLLGMLGLGTLRTAEKIKGVAR